MYAYICICMYGVSTLHLLTCLPYLPFLSVQEQLQPSGAEGETPVPWAVHRQNREVQFMYVCVSVCMYHGLYIGRIERFSCGGSGSSNSRDIDSI
jgi:hypothetical protein